MNERKTAAKILYDIEYNGAYTNIAITNAFREGEFSPVEKGFVSELVHGVTEKRITVDYIISQFSSLKINKIAPKVLTALRIGVYQIYFMDKVPPSAAVNESVKLAKAGGGLRCGGFVNGVLRSILRNKDEISYPKEKNRYLSVCYSYPLEIVEMLLGEFGFDFTENMLKAFNSHHAVTLRCNTVKTTPSDLQKSLADDGVDTSIYQNTAFPCINYALQTDRIKSIDKLTSYEKGEFYIQDVAAMLVAEVLNPKSGDTVIDMCAAPGGKTTHIAEKMQNRGVVHAFDIYDHKIKLINDNAKRLGLDICRASVWDASVLNEGYIEKADCVLVDAPCSGFGIMGRKPDIKYQRNVSDCAELAKLSGKILNNAAKYVKSGGTLVFSTCTIGKTENENVVEGFLSDNGESFYLEPIEQIKKENVGYVTLYPHIDFTDGFFICKFRKR